MRGCVCVKEGGGGGRRKYDRKEKCGVRRAQMFCGGFDDGFSKCRGSKTDSSGSVGSGFRTGPEIWAVRLWLNLRIPTMHWSYLLL